MIGNKREIISAAQNKLDEAIGIVCIHSDLFEKCKKYTQRWFETSKIDTGLSISDNPSGINIHLYVSKYVSQTSINLFIDDIKNELELKLISTDKYNNGTLIKYYFQNKKYANVHIFFHD